jgi:hypothetical protein
MKLFRFKLSWHLNFWIGTTLILANLFTWVGLLLTSTPYRVEAVLDPEVETLLAEIRSGNSSGKSWQVTLTELEAEQTITWYLRRYPKIPFEYPKVEITPDYIAGEGDATIAGLRVHVRGKARVTLVEGLPKVEFLDLNLPVPGWIRRAIEDEIGVQLRRADLLPVRFTSAEWRKGEVEVRGIIR